MKKNILKLVVFNLLLVLVNVLVFSGRGFGIKIDLVNVISSAFGVTVVILSVVGFIMYNGSLLFPKPKQERVPIKASSILSLEDCIEAATSYIRENVRTFSEELETCILQIKRFRKKQETLKSVLLDKFSETELSYVKYSSAILGLENMLFQSVKSMVSRLNAFDEEEYESRENTLSAHVIMRRNTLFDEYKEFVKQVVVAGEEVLLRMDQLISEVSKVTFTPDDSNSVILEDIDILIRNTKFYK